MTYVVNLSSTHTASSLHDVVTTFVRLLHPTQRTRCCLRFFDNVWRMQVLLQFWQNQALIKQYEAGEISTQDFLNTLCDIFSLKNDDTNQSRLKDAWNSMISFTKEDLKKFQKLLATRESIHLISNRNAMHIEKYIEWLKANFSSHLFLSAEILEGKSGESVMRLGPHIFLHASYQYGAYKTQRGKQSNTLRAPSLMQQVFQSMDIDVRTTIVVTQFQKDLDEAERLGVRTDNVLPADVFFSPVKRVNTDTYSATTSPRS